MARDPAAKAKTTIRSRLYRNMLRNLPAARRVRGHKDEIAGKAMGSKDADQALAHILSRILVLQDAETKSGKKKNGRAWKKTSNYEID